MAFARRATQSILVLIAATASLCASAQWRVQYEGPDSLTLVSRPNMAATNARSAITQSRDLPSGELGTMLAPIVTQALEGCSMDGVKRVVIAPQASADRIGDTMTRLHGFGVYVNLPLADRVSYGTWFIAPYFAIKVSLAGDSGDKESIDLAEFDRAIVNETLPMTQDRFLDARTEDVEKAIATFVKARLPSTLRKALGKRCA